MKEIAKAKVYEIKCTEEHWMFELGKLARVADKVIVKDFDDNCANNAFVRAISQHHNLSFYSLENNLVFEKRPEFAAKHP